MRAKITKRSVDACRPLPSGDVFLWDAELHGFGLRVTAQGTKSFVVSYYAPGLHRVRRRVTLGQYGPVTADDARVAAKAMLSQVASGEDPASQKAEERRAAKDETVAHLFKDYLEFGRAHFSPRTIESYDGCGRLYLLPALGPLPVRKVTTRDVAQLHLKLRKKPHTANRCVQLIKAFFYWLERRGLFDGRNPARGIELYAENARERFLSVEEMARLGQALRVAETVGLAPAPEHAKLPTKKKRLRRLNTGMFKSEILPANPVSLAALRFLVLTGWREQEAVTLRWADVDFTAGIATLSNTKSGKSVRPIGAPALELLSAQPQVNDSAYIFPGRDPKKPLESVHRLWTAVRHEAKLGDVRLHDLRHSVASVAGEHGYSLFLIGKLLGHRTARSTERYAHLADDARKVMADAVAESIQVAMSGAAAAARTKTRSARRRRMAR